MIPPDSAPAGQHPLLATRVARALSILGHPLPVMAATALAAWQGAERGRWMLAAFLGAASILVMGYASWRVRRGQWAHVDASGRGERRDLHRALGSSLCVAVAVGLWRDVAPPIVVVLGLCLAIVVAAGMASRWCKPSLHVAFACLGTAVLALGCKQAALPMAMAVVAIGWSRLHLRRHSRTDVIAGAAIGTGAAVALWLAMARMAP